MTNGRNNQRVNPFHIQGYIRDEKLFCGRQAELAEIWGYLRKGYNVFILAPRQPGKSSLLWYIKNGDFFPWNVQMMDWCWYDSGLDLEKALEKYRKFLEDKKIPGPLFNRWVIWVQLE